MGAMLWFHKAPWHPDPNQSLIALQTDFVREHYDLEKLLTQQLTSAKQHMQAEINSGDEFGLVEGCQRKVSYLEELNSKPIPKSIQSQIEIVRNLHNDGDGVGNILDVKEVTDQRAFLKAEQLSEQKAITVVGYANPNLVQAEAAVGKINAGLGRGECVCFQVYEDGIPIAWYFVGNTID